MKRERERERQRQRESERAREREREIERERERVDMGSYRMRDLFLGAGFFSHKRLFPAFSFDQNFCDSNAGIVF